MLKKLKTIGPQNGIDISFREIAEKADDVIVVTTADLALPGPRIIYVNPAFTRLTGYSVEEALRATPRMLQGPGTSRKTLDKIGTKLRAGAEVHEKILNYAKDGTSYWLDLRIMPLRDSNGEIKFFAAIERDITRDKHRVDELEHLVDRDPLTGIPNRRALLRWMEAEIERVHRNISVSGPCIAYIDVDHFKAVNDQFGHATGDAVLCGVAKRLAGNIRRLDMLGRLGGEEFCICMPSLSQKGAIILAERLRQSIAATPFETPFGPKFITVSIGVVAFDVGSDLKELLKHADAAMYVAKQNGRNRVVVHNEHQNCPDMKQGLQV
ncbi:MAG: diguanylate cyclase [Acidocella sp.]|nr:diguanylate cyclase [Acidocella sp.]